jgi:heme exporter protein D
MESGAVGSGMIYGGWEYVWVVYGVSWAVLVAYTVVALVLRGRALSSEHASQEPTS